MIININSGCWIRHCCQYHHPLRTSIWFELRLYHIYSRTGYMVSMVLQYIIDHTLDMRQKNIKQEILESRKRMQIRSISSLVSLLLNAIYYKRPAPLLMARARGNRVRVGSCGQRLISERRLLGVRVSCTQVYTCTYFVWKKASSFGKYDMVLDNARRKRGMRQEDGGVGSYHGRQPRGKVPGML